MVEVNDLEHAHAPIPDHPVAEKTARTFQEVQSRPKTVTLMSVSILSVSLVIIIQRRHTKCGREIVRLGGRVKIRVALAVI